LIQGQGLLKKTITVLQASVLCIKVNRNSCLNVADPHHFDAVPDANPDPTHHFDADSDPDADPDFCIC
jgi:hypothetical protein